MDTLSRLRTFARSAALIAFMTLLSGTNSQAQEHERLPTWPGLRATQLPAVWVTDHRGEEVRGHFLALGPDTLTLLVGDTEQVFPRSDIARIERRDSLKNGAITGALIGLAMGVVSSGLTDCPTGNTDSCRSFALAIIPLSTAVYTGVGVAIDAAIPGRTTIYEADSERTRIGRLRRPGGALAFTTGVSW